MHCNWSDGKDVSGGGLRMHRSCRPQGKLMLLESSVQKELAVALGAEDGRINGVQVLRTQLRESRLYSVESCQLDGFVANDAALAHVLAAGFELGLYQDDHLVRRRLGCAPRKCRVYDCRQHQ